MKTVLIIDDYSFFVDGLELFLGQVLEDTKILSASSFGQARRILHARFGVDLIVFDPDIRETQECDISTMLGVLRKRAPVVVMAELASPDRVHRMMESGAMAYIEKRTAKYFLRTCLQVLKQGRSYLPERVEVELQHNRNTSLLEYQQIDGRLSERQKEVLVLLANGYTNHDISACLGITQSTVKSHVSKLMHTFDVDNRTGCVAGTTLMGIL